MLSSVTTDFSPGSIIMIFAVADRNITVIVCHCLFIIKNNSAPEGRDGAEGADGSGGQLGSSQSSSCSIITAVPKERSGTEGDHRPDREAPSPKPTRYVKKGDDINGPARFRLYKYIYIYNASSSIPGTQLPWHLELNLYILILRVQVLTVLFPLMSDRCHRTSF